MNEYDETQLVAKTMAERGTVFTRLLGQALYIGSRDQQARIKEAFPEMYAIYLRKAQEADT